MKNVITNDDILSLREKVRAYLTEKRYAHTLAVERMAEYLGKIYLPEKINELRCAALLHDITKKCDLEKQLQYCSEFGIIVCDYDILSPKTFHAKTAECVVRRDFSDFATPDVLSGVRWHTTGHDGMTVFEAIVYLADYIEDTRTFPDCVTLRQYFYDGLETECDRVALLYRTMIKSFDMTVKCLIEENSPIDTDTVTARSFYIKSLKALNL
jgi:nicotinate-nucleotide adenylyltransferase